MEPAGFEPATFCMPCRRATSCAKAPKCPGTRVFAWISSRTGSPLTWATPGHGLTSAGLACLPDVLTLWKCQVLPVTFARIALAPRDGRRGGRTRTSGVVPVLETGALTAELRPCMQLCKKKPPPDPGGGCHAGW